MFKKKKKKPLQLEKLITNHLGSINLLKMLQWFHNNTSCSSSTLKKKKANNYHLSDPDFSEFPDPPELKS